MKLKNRRLLLLSLLVAIVFILLYQVTDAFWNIRWFDSLMHFTGGFLLGTFGLWLWFVSGIFGTSTPTKKEAFVAAVAFALLAGVWWEFFEYVHGIARPIGSYSLDTFDDLCADLAGGIVAGIICARKSFYE